jgi:hypothetical protein
MQKRRPANVTGAIFPYPKTQHFVFKDTVLHILSFQLLYFVQLIVCHVKKTYTGLR